VSPSTSTTTSGGRSSSFFFSSFGSSGVSADGSSGVGARRSAAPSSPGDTGRPSGLAPNGDGVRAASGTRNGRHDAGNVRSNACSS
jgi:hypothetical protein